MRIALWACAAVLLPAFSLGGQSIQGLAVDRATQKPIPNVRVELVDTSGGEWRQTKSDSSGYFALVAPLDGVYRLRFSLPHLSLGYSPNILLTGDTIVERMFVLDIDDSASRVFFEFQVEQRVAPIPAPGGPRYPKEMREQRIEGQVFAQFIVDTTGRVVRGSFKSLKATQQEFIEAVQSYLATARYQPAMLGGRKVRQLVQQPFNFTLTY